MEEILSYIQENVDYAPLMIFSLLLLAGLNFPVSEDAMLFISALLAAQYPQKVAPLFLGVFLGAYGSDLISYGLGKFLGPKLWKIRYFRKMVSQDRVEKLRVFYQKNAWLTLGIGRFIPFGVRNALFLTAGLSKMNFLKFAFIDLMAAILSCGTYFSLYYAFGNDVVAYVKKGNLVFFTLFLLAVSFYFYRKFRKKS
ncbi:MAG: DedA family protein [Bacteriovoracales bacterium]|nr:DedA family protein [Bacteriovoracales bacterium]